MSDARNKSEGLTAMLEPEFSSYLNAIDAGQALTERVESSLTVFNLLCTEPIKRIFISDRLNRDTGDRDFSSLWGFSDTYWLSTKTVLTDWNADIAAYKRSIWYLGLTYQDLVITDDAVNSSRLFVEVSSGRLDRNELSATGKNCPFLWKIIVDLFRPNLRTELT